MALCKLHRQIAAFLVLSFVAGFFCINLNIEKSGITLRLLGPSRKKRESSENHPFHHSTLMVSTTSTFGAVKHLPEYVYIPIQYFIEEDMRRRRNLLVQRQRAQELLLRRILLYLRQLGRTAPNPGAVAGGGGGTGSAGGLPPGSLSQSQADTMANLINSLFPNFGSKR